MCQAEGLTERVIRRRPDLPARRARDHAPAWPRDCRCEPPKARPGPRSGPCVRRMHLLPCLPPAPDRIDAATQALDRLAAADKKRLVAQGIAGDEEYDYDGKG